MKNRHTVDKLSLHEDVLVGGQHNYLSIQSAIEACLDRLAAYSTSFERKKHARWYFRPNYTYVWGQ